MGAITEKLNDHGIPRVAEPDYDAELTIVQDATLVRAMSELGYAPREQTPAGRQNDKLVLSRALVAAGVEPLDDAAVLRYKLEKKRTANKGCWRIGIQFACTLTGMISGAFLADPHWWWIALSVLLGGVFGTVLGVMANIYPAWPNYTWQLNTLHQGGLNRYGEPIPTAVLAVALSIHDANKNVCFEVEHLADREHYPDPFLVARLGSARAYVAVWDEPKFE